MHSLMWISCLRTVSRHPTVRTRSTYIAWGEMGGEGSEEVVLIFYASSGCSGKLVHFNLTQLWELSDNSSILYTCGGEEWAVKEAKLNSKKNVWGMFCPKLCVEHFLFILWWSKSSNCANDLGIVCHTWALGGKLLMWCKQICGIRNQDKKQRLSQFEF